MTAIRPALLPVLLAGGLLLLAVHTLDRFIYTPLLPWLVEDGPPPLKQGAAIASWNYLGYLIGALLVGGTFLGTVLLTQRLGRSLQPHQGPRISAALIALYSVTQLAGPWLTSQWLGNGWQPAQRLLAGRQRAAVGAVVDVRRAAQIRAQRE